MNEDSSHSKSMIMMTYETNIKIKFTKHDKSCGTTLYTVFITNPSGFQLVLKERYKNMRKLYTQIKKLVDVGTLNKLPPFPPKRFINNLKEEFL